MGSLFVKLEEMVGIISEINSTIDQGIDDGNLGSDDKAKLEDITDQAQGLLATRKNMYLQFLDEGEQPAMGTELSQQLSEGIDQAQGLLEEVHILVGHQEQ